jgi:hypothetical protein
LQVSVNNVGWVDKPSIGAVAEVEAGYRSSTQPTGYGLSASK